MAPVTSAVQYDLQQARFSRHLWGQSFSEHHIYTDSRGAWVGPSTTAKQSQMESQGGEKRTTGLLLHPVHTSMNSSLAFDVHSQRPLTASIKRRQNIFSDLPLGAEGRQDLPLTWFSCLPRCHLRQGCFLVLAPSSSSAAPRVLAGTSPSQAVLASSPLLRGISASLRRLLCISAPLDGQVNRADTRRQNKGDKKRDKG